MAPYRVDVMSVQNWFVQVVQKFMRLGKLQLIHDYLYSPFKNSSCKAYPTLLPLYLSLVYCSVYCTPFVVVEIITKCKYLKNLRCTIVTTDYVSSLDLKLAAPNQLLEYLHIDSKDGHIGKTFMDSVSAHGKLEDVTFDVCSVSVSGGVIALIWNSPKLRLFNLYSKLLISAENVVTVDLQALQDTLEKNFKHRKLFNLNEFKLSHISHAE